MTTDARDRFEDRGVVARGGMSVVHRMYDRVLGREVAVKLVDARDDPHAVERFLDEARLTGGLEHPAIVPIYDVITDGPGTPVRLVMKLITGRTLADVLQNPPIPAAGPPLERFLRTFVRLCEAVEFAHSRGIVHRDITPRNVMIGSFGEVYLMDWGLAVRRGEHGERLRVGEPGGVPASPGSAVDVIGSGTPAYMSPEQAWGRLQSIDERTDVFGLGGILYEMLTRVPPYPSTRPIDLLAEARSGSVRPPAAVVTDRLLPPVLCAITMRALDAEPGRRYPSVQELREAVEGFLRGGGWFATQRFPRGSLMMRTGEVGDVAYIVTEGRCVVYRMIDGERRELRVVGPGEVVGEIALVTRAPRNANVEAATDVTALVVTRPALEQELARATWMRVFVDAAVQRFASLDEQTARTRS